MTRVLAFGDAMSRRDFRRVAESLGAIDDEVRRSDQTARWIEVFRAANPRFDTRRFVEAVEQVVAQRRTRRAAERWRSRSRATW